MKNTRHSFRHGGDVHFSSTGLIFSEEAMKSKKSKKEQKIKDYKGLELFSSPILILYGGYI